MRGIKLGAVLLAAALGCSGGGGGGSGGSGGSGVTTGAAAQGPILGFGSIFVGGDRWATGGATILRDGRSVSESELALGMVVRVEGERTGPASGIATRVVFDEELEGPISALVPDGPDRVEATIFGTTVVIDRGRTVFEHTSFDALSVGDYVEVSGLPDVGDTLLATYVEGKGPFVLGVSEVELSGVVENAQPAAGLFEIRGVTVVVDAPGIDTEIDDLLGVFVQDGDRVEVEGVLDGLGRVLAQEVEREDAFLDDDVGDFEVEGIVTDFVSLADFVVAGVPVDASSASFQPDRPDLVEDGVRVEVEGMLIGGVLIADEVELRGSEVVIHAAVAFDADVDPLAGSLVLLGIPIVVPASLELEDDRDEVAPFTLEDIVAGDFLEVRGVADGAGGVLASEIERVPTEAVVLRGRVEAFDEVAGTLVILGVTVPTDADTDFEAEDESPLLAADFFGLLEIGSLVEVEDEPDGDPTAIDVADEVEFEQEDDDTGFDDWGRGGLGTCVRRTSPVRRSRAGVAPRRRAGVRERAPLPRRHMPGLPLTNLRLVVTDAATRDTLDSLQVRFYPGH